MRSKHEDRDREPRSGDEPEIDPASGRKPVYFDTSRPFAQYTVREGGAVSLMWPIDTPEFAEMVARRNLEQVGHILHRLDLDQADIVQLRDETRAILAELAA